MIDKTLDILKSLLQLDTQNPPRKLDADGELVRFLRSNLDGFDIETTDHGAGRITLLATRGEPTVLFNVHLDTVPAGEQWSVDPLEMTIQNGKVFGRGACDTKGGAACLLDLAKSTPVDLALLFTTDEEGTESCCVENFCKTPKLQDFKAVVVAEPTQCIPVTQHRGYLSVAGRFSGESMHTSQCRDPLKSAVHQATEWSATALSTVEQFESNLIDADGQRDSCCFNIGRIDGGIKNNMVADSCLLTWSARVPPGIMNEDFVGILGCENSSQDNLTADWLTTFSGPSLLTTVNANPTIEQLIGLCGVDFVGAVDFWTEASIFAAHGIPSLVFGPGDIAQAHTADEWVSVSQLEQAMDIYQLLVAVK